MPPSTLSQWLAATPSSAGNTRTSSCRTNAWLRQPWADMAACVVFSVAAITDYFDGKIARDRGVTSSFGRMLDPIADKLLVSVCLLVLTYHGTIGGFSLWAAVIILMREIFVSGLREFLADLKVSVPVSRLAKWKTTLQLIAIGILLLGPTGDKLVDGITELGIVLLWTAAIVTLYTGYDYFRSGVVYLMEERHEP